MDDYNVDEYPVAVTLRFRNDRHKQEFFNGLSDSWGENYCDLEWDRTEHTTDHIRSGKSFDEAKEFLVESFFSDRDGNPVDKDGNAL